MADRGALLVTLLLAAGSAHADPTLPDPAFFKQSWCPLAREVDALEEHFDLRRNGCCIFRADRRDFTTHAAVDAIAPFREQLVALPDMNICTGSNPEVEAQHQAAIREQQAEAAAAAAQERRELAANLRKLDFDDLCTQFGALLRDGSPMPAAWHMGKAALPAARAELRRRALSVHERRVAEGRIRVGDSVCHLLAAWGWAERRNRTTYASGVHIQWVYSGSYVYTRNGAIESIQD